MGATQKKIFLFDEAGRLFTKAGLTKALHETWAWLKSLFENFKKTELYAVFMHNTFAVQTVYLTILLIGGVALIEFLVANYLILVSVSD